MLRHSFVHIPGIGSKTERLLWREGVHTWNDLVKMGPSFLGKVSRDFVLRYLEESENRLRSRDARFFGEALPERELWRIFGDFRDSVAYIDVETSGGGPGLVLTTIALYDGNELRTYVQGDNLWEFPLDIKGYKVIVTYNGKCFDLPVIKEQLGCDLNQVHIDLRFVLGSLGYKGGLKACERMLGIERGELEDVDGYYAVLFWEEFCNTGDPRALETLLAYNAADAVNLEPLMFWAYNLKLSETPFNEKLSLSVPIPRAVPFEAHKGLIQRIRERIEAKRTGRHPKA